MTDAAQSPRSCLVDSGECIASVLELFEQQVRETPSAIAVQFEERETTYAQLNELANQFANGLKQYELPEGSTVGFCLSRSTEAIAAMIGAFKYGAAFVPLDSDFPLERIRYMVKDAGIALLIGDGDSQSICEEILQHSQGLNYLDCSSFEFANLSHRFESVTLDASQRAYIMYTSGSTGKPKGVQIDHRALTTYCMADIETYRLKSTDRTLQFSTLCFDIAIEETLPPLLIGSCIVVRPRQRSAASNELSEIVREYNITALHLATAYWHEWVDLMCAAGDEVPHSLRLVIATGEKVSVEHYRRWKGRCNHNVLWCNAYGPTETTVTATVFIPEDDFDLPHMPIGRPLPGYTAEILDESLSPVDTGETGNLYIGGPALAIGYLNRPELTEAAFVEVDLPDQGTTRLYRTGDLARWMEDGNIDFAGRVDHQIKLGSYRIEPGEIESVFNQHPSIRDSLVIYEQVESQKYLVAYLVVSQPGTDLLSIDNYARQHLPTYMVPPRYCLVDSLPKTINGKIDRKALPDATQSTSPRADQHAEPRDAIEKLLATTWQRVLQIPQIGIHDDFFALGGSSLLVAKVISEIAVEHDLTIPVRDFFANPTIACMARQLRTLSGGSTSVGHDTKHREAHTKRPVLEPQFIGPPACQQIAARQMFAVYYHPVRQNSGVQSRGILLCNSYGHEYSRAYRNLQQLGLHLAMQGYPVLRFDYFGTGNSSGECDDCRVESMQGDIRQAVKHLRKTSNCESITLVGVRMGATLAASAQALRVDQLVLWDPVVDGKQMIRTFADFHEYALSSQTRFARLLPTAFDGQLYGHSMNSEKLSSFRSLKLPSEPVPNSLVVLSKDYAQYEAHSNRLNQWNCLTTNDEIYWHRPEYAECAFSSPGVFRAVSQFIKQGILH